MKNLIQRICLVALLSLTGFQLSWAQQGLGISSMGSFPIAPADSAYEGQQYGFVISVLNQTSLAVTGSSMQINLRVDSITSTIITTGPVTINNNDSVSVQVTGYNFTNPQFKAGNNIVVVWPVIQNGVIAFVDTFYADVYFIPLNSLGEPDIQDQVIHLFPNPAVHSVILDLPNGILPERVRIYDLKGELVKEMKPDRRNIDVSFLSSGTYFLEWKSGSTLRSLKLIKE